MQDYKIIIAKYALKMSSILFKILDNIDKNTNLKTLDDSHNSLSEYKLGLTKEII